jgi:LuxR family maltose regulon positive regulatory protein
MLAYQALGKSEKAEKTRQLLLDYVASLDDPVYTALADACQVRLALLQGRPGPAIRWLETSEPPAPEVMIWWLEVPGITHCRALIAEGSLSSLSKAEERLREYMTLNQAHHNTCQLIYILLLLSLTCEKQGRAEEALKLLERAVILAEPGGFVFPFLELGSPMANLLERLLSRGKGGYYIEKLLDAMKAKKNRPSQRILRADRADVKPISQVSIPNEIELLTPQELKIVTHLAEGLNNQDIADKLFISPSTVKSHLYNIYQKWEVKSRLAAAEKARRLGIIR